MKQFSVQLGVVALLLVGLSGCGGGGGTTTGGGTPAGSTVTGTAATGLPVANATLVFKGKNGQQVTATTSATGAYILSTGSLTSPYFVKVTTAAATPNYPAGSVFYSVSADAAPSVVNVTPLTDLVVRSWYQAQPTPVTADAAFANPVANPPPEPGVVTVIENVVRQIVGNLLNANGVNPATLNLISTPFAANGAGVDAALDATQVNAASGIVTTGALTTTITAASGVISTTAVSGVASTSTSVIVPTNTQAATISGIQTAVDAFAAVVNAKGTQLADTDILPLLDANAMLGGLNRAQTAIGLASMSRAVLTGDTISMKVLSLDSVTTNIAQATMLYTRTTNGASGADRRSFVFAKQVNGQWLWAGDMRIAQIWVDAQTDAIYQSASAVPAVTTGLAVDVQVLQPASGGPTLTAAAVPTINGTGLISTNLIANGTSITSDVPAPGVAPVNHTSNNFSSQNTLSNMAVTVGSTYTVTIPVSTGSVSYPFTMGAVTNEAISITGLTAGLANAKLGTPLTVNWTLPSTFTVLGVQLDGSSQNGATNCYPVGSPPLLPATATSSTITLPATCGGPAATGAAVTVSIWGANGEKTHAQFVF
jgi:hypothetical protein